MAKRLTKGYFIALEGIDGCGKTTVAEKLARGLGHCGFDLLLTREPGGSPWGQRLRQELLYGGQINWRTEALLFAADRAEHVATVIAPALAAPKIVICDRYTASTIAYQGGGRGIDADLLQTLNQFATGNLTPDLTLLFDLPPEMAAHRRQMGKFLGDIAPGKDRLEQEDLSFFTAVRASYLQQAAAEQATWRIINAALGLEAVYGAALAAALCLIGGTDPGIAKIGAEDEAGHD